MNEIICADCLEVLKSMPDKSVDLVLTDPPYGLGFSYLGYEDTRDNLKRLIAEFLPLALQKATRTAVLCGITQIGLYPQADWCGCITWETTGSYGHFGYTQWMPILLYGKDLSGFGRVNGVLKSDRIHLNGGFRRSPLELSHPCPKPLKIMEEVIERYCEAGGTVLDPFAGSGTTCVAAKILGRKYIGIEISPVYAEIARKRVEQAQYEERLFAVTA